MKKIIYIYLLMISISNIHGNEFWKELTFGKGHNDNFELTFQSSGALFISVEFGTPDIVVLAMLFGGRVIQRPVTPPGIGEVIFYEKGDTNKIQLVYMLHTIEKGIIKLQPTTEEIKVDLNKTYEWKYDLKKSDDITSFY